MANRDIMLIEEYIRNNFSSNPLQKIEAISQEITSLVDKKKGEFEVIQEAIAFIGEEKYLQIIEKTVYGNLLLIFQKTFSFLELREYDICTVATTIQTNIENWNESILSKGKNSPKREESVQFAEDLLLFFFPEKEHSLYLALPKMVELAFGGYIRKYLFNAISEYVIRNIDFLFSAHFRKQLLSFFYTSHFVIKRRFSISVSQEEIDQNEFLYEKIAPSIRSIIESTIPEYWKKKIPFLPIRQAILSLYVAFKNRYSDKRKREEDFLFYALLLIELGLLEKEKVDEKPISDDELVVLAEKWIEKKEVLDGIASFFMPFSQEKLMKGLKNNQMISKNNSPALLTIAFTQEMQKKSSEALSTHLEWDENSPKWIRKITRYILSDHFSALLKSY